MSESEACSQNVSRFERGDYAQIPDMFLDDFGTVEGPLEAHLGVIWGAFGGHFGVIFGM